MPTRAEQMRMENEEMRARIAELETYVQAMDTTRACTPIDPEEERSDNDPLIDDPLNDLDSVNDPVNDSLKDAVAALVRSQQTIMERMVQDGRRKQKVYVAMPEQFNGKVGNFIDAWLEK